MTNNKLAVFRQLHTTNKPLLIPNAWDAVSAAVIEKAGAKAIATSSAAVSWSFGYKDGSTLPLELLKQFIQNIVRVCSVPVSIDIEGGYSDSPIAVANFVSDLVDAGVVGINLEDGSESPSLLEEKIAAIRETKNGKNIFINARTDVFLRQLCAPEDTVAEVIKRATRYAHCGSDSLFVPGLYDPIEVSEVSNNVAAPLNIMLLNDQMDIKELHLAGARRFSTGPGSSLASLTALFKSASDLLSIESSDNSVKELDFSKVDSLF